MILTVTLNFALDVTYHLPRVEWGKTNQVASVARQAGGKGVNAARTLHALGHPVVVSGLAGGAAGLAAQEELTAAGLVDETVKIAGESRTTLIVVEQDGGATGFSEPGPQVSAAEWRVFTGRFRELVSRASAVVLSGSIPPGVPADAYAQLIAVALQHGIPALLDTHGDPLLAGVAARPTIVKINAEELRGVGLPADRSLISAAGSLRRLGPVGVVVSDGPGGLIAVIEAGNWHTAPPEALRGNPTGAGDAASAALIVGAANGTPWAERLADAAALSAAAVCAPLAGSFDEQVYRRLRDEIVAKELPQSAPGSRLSL